MNENDNKKLEELQELFIKNVLFMHITTTLNLILLIMIAFGLLRIARLMEYFFLGLK